MNRDVPAARTVLVHDSDAPHVTSPLDVENRVEQGLGQDVGMPFVYLGIQPLEDPHVVRCNGEHLLQDEKRITHVLQTVVHPRLVEHPIGRHLFSSHLEQLYVGRLITSSRLGADGQRIDAATRTVLGAQQA